MREFDKPDEHYVLREKALIAAFSALSKEELVARLANQITMEELKEDLRAHFDPQVEAEKKKLAEQLLPLEAEGVRLQIEIARVQERFAAPKQLGQRGGKSRSSGKKYMAVSLAKQHLSTLRSKPSRAAVVAAILNDLRAAIRAAGLPPLVTQNESRTVNGWLKECLPKDSFKAHGGTRTA